MTECLIASHGRGFREGEILDLEVITVTADTSVCTRRDGRVGFLSERLLDRLGLEQHLQALGLAVTDVQACGALGRLRVAGLDCLDDH